MQATVPTALRSHGKTTPLLPPAPQRRPPLAGARECNARRPTPPGAAPQAGRSCGIRPARTGAGHAAQELCSGQHWHALKLRAWQELGTLLDWPTVSCFQNGCEHPPLHTRHVVKASRTTTCALDPPTHSSSSSSSQGRARGCATFVSSVVLPVGYPDGRDAHGAAVAEASLLKVLCAKAPPVRTQRQVLQDLCHARPHHTTPCRAPGSKTFGKSTAEGARVLSSNLK